MKALDGVNLEVQEGEFIAVMGPSGSGKTTLLNMIGALDRPTSGRVMVDDIDLSEEKGLDEFRARRIGFVFQLHNLLPTLTARENVEVPMFELGLSNKERVKRAEKLLKQVGLGERLDFVPAKLSAGERQRVAIARALANNPKIILADEPTGNLDSVSGDNVVHLLRRLNKEGQTIVLVTHDEEMAVHANKVYCIRDGKIME
ncbi:MAG: ABC transporter ATP-binding protein [Candidatus Bathyarchaeia archaeon]